MNTGQSPMGVALLLMSLTLISTTLATAQTRTAPRSIFEALEGEGIGEGRIVIEQSDEVRKLVGAVAPHYGTTILGREGNTTLLMGYRIQFFNSNLASSRTEAENRANHIRAIAPDLSVYVTFNAPFWRLIVGDFQTQEEARQMRSRLLPLLPKWGKESYVVRSKVRILNYTPQNYD